MEKSSLSIFCCVCCIALLMTSACKKDDTKKSSGSGTSTDSSKTDTVINPPPQTYWLPIEFHDTSGLYTNDTLYLRVYFNPPGRSQGAGFYGDTATGGERNGKLIYLKGDYYQATLSTYMLFKRGVDSITIAALVAPVQGGEFGWYDPQKILSGDTTYHIQIKY